MPKPKPSAGPGDTPPHATPSGRDGPAGAAVPASGPPPAGASADGASADGAAPGGPAPAPDPAAGRGAAPARGAYRAVLHLTGRALPVVSFLGRLPIAMCQLGSLLLVTRTSGSVAQAGLVAGVLAAGQTVGGPLVGRLADRRGQRPVVLAAALANAAAVTALTLAALARLGTAELAALGALAGLTVPQIGPLSRTRTVTLARRGTGTAGLVPAVLSLEGALEEVSFVLGPALVGVAATAFHPAAALLAAAVLGAVCGTLFALHPTAPGALAGPAAGRGRRPRNPPAGYALRGSMALQGAVFGAIQAGLTALTADLGAPGQSGLVYAAMGVTSALMAPVMGMLPERFALERRMLLAVALQTVLAVPLLWAGAVWQLYAVTALLGLTYAPHMISVFGVTERVAPPSRLSESMAFLTSALVGGQAVGLAVSGRLADAVGAHAAFAVAGGAACAAVLVAAALARHPRPPR